MFTKLKNTQNYFLLFALSFYLIAVAFHITDPLIYDEVDFVVNSPILSVHPPLYFGIMHALKNLFGPHEFIFRGFGVITGLISTLLIYQISEILKKGSGKIAASLYLILPVFIQGSLLIDIDNTLLNLEILLFFFAYLKLKDNKFRFIVYFLLFFLMFWTKTTTVKIVWLPFVLYEIFGRRNYKNALIILIAFVLALVSLYNSLQLFSNFIGIDFYSPTLKHNSLNLIILSRQFLHPSYYLKIAFGVHIFMMWVSPYFLVILGINTFEQIKSKKIDLLATLLTLILSIMIPYILLRSSAGGFPKYLFPVFGIASVFIGINGNFSIDNLNKKNVIAAFFVLIIFLAFLNDPIKSPFIIKEATIKDATIINRLLSFYVHKYLILFGAFLLFHFSTGNKLKDSLLFLTFIYCLNVAAYQILADYNVGYAYGEKGIKKVVSYIKNNNISEKQTLARKHITSYASNFKIAIDNPELISNTTKPEQLNHILSNTTIDHMFVHRLNLYINPDRTDFLRIVHQNNFKLSETLYDYLLYQRK